MYDIHDGREGRQQLECFARLVTRSDYPKVDRASISSSRNDLGRGGRLAYLRRSDGPKSGLQDETPGRLERGVERLRGRLP
jgi:hypothetical protein